MKNIYAIVLVIVFFALTIKVNGQTQKNEFTEVSTEENSLKASTIYDVIRLKIENQYIFDATVIYYYETFSDGIGREDSEKMFNSSEKIPEIFTRVNNTAMAINGFSELGNQSYIAIPVSVRNRVWDECEISVKLDDFTDEYDVVLEDKEKGHYTNLRASTYKYTPSVLGTEHERFVLHLSRTSQVTTNINEAPNKMEDEIRFSSDFGQLQVSISETLLAGSNQQAEINVYSRNGKKLVSRNATAGFNQIELTGGQIYIVSVKMGNQTTTKKVAVR